MIHAKKMVLVDEVPSAPAPVGSFSAMDSEMERILSRRDISEYEKWALYDQILQKYLVKIRGVENKPSENIEPAPIEEQSDVNLMLLQNGLTNKKQKVKAELILSLLEKSSIVSWNNAGDVSVFGQPLPSKIFDLVKMLLVQDNKVHPKGWEIFASALKHINIPAEYISNSFFKNYLTLKDSKIIERRSYTPKLSENNAKKKKIRWQPYK
jgi:hypothetical protein